MTSQPLHLTIVGWLFIVTGSIGLSYHLLEFDDPSRAGYGLLGVCLIRLAAIVAGAFLLRGAGWARWLLVVWMAYHVVLSAFHSLAEVVMHVLLFGIIGWLLFTPRSSAYFRGVADRATTTSRRSEPPVA